MARTARRGSATGIFHVMLRGVGGQVIFEADGDREQFLEALAKAKELSQCEVFAYCLMPNHVHLLVRPQGEPLSQFMRRLSTRYAQWFNGHHGRVGHLFQDRFRSEPVETDEYLVTVLRYIWNNPVKAGLCKKAVQYAWSSRRLADTGSGLVDEAALLGLVSVKRLSDLDVAGDDGEVSLSLEATTPVVRPSDERVLAILAESFGVSSTADFQRLDAGQQREVLQQLRERSASIRQLARITGLTARQVQTRTDDRA